MDSLDPQLIINGLFGLLMFSLGYILNSVRRAVYDLQHEDSRLAEKVQSIEVLVAGGYVTRDEFDKKVDRLFEKLDKISNKLDGKADR